MRSPRERCKEGAKNREKAQQHLEIRNKRVL